MENITGITVIIIISIASGYLAHILYIRFAERKRGAVYADYAENVIGSFSSTDIQDELLYRLISKGSIFDRDFDRSVKEITEAGAGILKCGRCSIWLVNDDCSLIRCIDLYSAERDEHSRGDELKSSEFPLYINALMKDLLISVSDVFTDPRTVDIPALYFTENGVTSLIDVLFWNSGKLSGIMSFEHTGVTRKWTRDEERFALIMSTVISLRMESERRSSAERELREADFLFRSVGDNLQGGMIYQVMGSADGKRRFTYLSAGVKNLHSLTPEQVISDPSSLYSQILSEDLEMVVEKENFSMKHMLPFDVEVRFRDPSGRMRWSRLLAHPRLMKNGDVIYDGIEMDITERKQYELDLAESERKYRMLYESMMDAFVVVTMDGRVVECNDAYLKLTGYTGEDLKKLSYMDITPEKWHAFEKEIIDNQVLKKGYSDLYEKEYRRKDGADVPIELRAYLIPGMTEEDNRIWGIVRDISGRKKNEALLRENEENLRITLDSIGDAVISTDINGNIVRMNPASIRLTGWGIDEAQGRSITDVFRLTGSERRKSNINPVEEVLRTGEVVFLEEDTMLESRNGGEYRIMDSAAPIINDSGDLAGVVLVFRDITEQFRLEQEARQNALSFRTIFETSPYAIVITRASDERYLMVNPTFEKNSGFTTDEIVGKRQEDLGRIVDPLERQKATELLKQQGRIDNMVVKVMTKDGVERYTMFSSRIIEFHGETCVLTVTMDITEMRHMQEQLSHAQRMDAIGQLAGGIAHDFNNMLGGIMGAAELLQNRISSDEKMNKYIQMIRSTAERAASLTGKLLAFSRKSAIEEVNIDLHGILEETAELLGRTIDKKVNIKIELNAADHVISGDMSQLVNVFVNLGINAAHAMPDGGDLTFTTRVVDLDERYCRVNSPDLKPGKFIIVEVRDTGCGIPAEYIGKVFEPFFTTREKGTGLGLASAYGIVRQHHGFISVYSELGRGTIFHVYLPLSGVKAAKTDAVVEVRHGSGRILVVDDEEIMRITAKELLQYLGYEVVVAVNGKEGVEIFEREGGRFNLVLLDMVMPVMNGRECFAELKRIDPSVKVIVSSGFAVDENLNEMRNGGLSGFIRKPFQTADLSRVVAEVLTRGGEEIKPCD